MSFISIPVRIALRRAARRPAHKLLVIGTLALGLASVITVSSIVRGLLMEPLAYPNPDRIVRIDELDVGDDSSAGPMGFTTFDDLRGSLRSFDSVAASATRSYTLVGDGDPEQLQLLAVSPEMFPTLGVRPVLGRSFLDQDDDRSAPRTVILSHELWSRRFGGDPSVVGRTIQMSGTPFEVIGVMPPGTRIRTEEWRDSHVDAWVSLRYATSLPWACRGCRHLQVLGRLSPGVSVDEAAREMSTFFDSLRAQYPNDYSSGESLRVVRLQDAVVGPAVSNSLWIVFGVSVLVLAIAITNAAGIRLAEIVERRNELMTRLMFGATRRRLLLEVLLETMFEALIASVAGVAMAAGAIALLRDRAAVLPRSGDLQLDLATAAFGIALAIVGGTIIGLLPLTGSGSLSWRPAHRGEIGHGSRTRVLLVGANVALSVILLFGAALLLRSVTNLFSRSPGFESASVLTFKTSVGSARYEDASEITALWYRFSTEAARRPGVVSAALTTQLPFDEIRDGASMHAEDRPDERESEAPGALRFGITPAYFDTMGIRLIRGRVFDESDQSTSEPVVILSETAARILWGDRDPLGRKVRIAGGDGNPYRTVVGLVADVAPGDLGAPPSPQSYLPISQFAAQSTDVIGVVRTLDDPMGHVATVREVLHGLDPEVPVYQFRSLSTMVAASEARRTFVLSLLSVFSMVSLGLAVAGLYGLLSWAVASRTREVGVRMALGATTMRIFGLVASQGLRVVLASLLVGLVGAMALSRFLGSLLFGVEPIDPVSALAVSLLLVCAGVVSCLIPGWQAARLSPMEALRDE